MYKDEVISLTRTLIGFNTINPPGCEKQAALFLGGILTGNGFRVNYSEFGKDRFHVIAEKGLSDTRAPIVLSGHLDVVPLGNKPWNVDPFAGEIREGKLFGRGSSDMKSGVAAIVIAAIEAFKDGSPREGVRLIFTAGEELGCQGIQHLSESCKHLGRASGIIIAEPTANLPVIGHKGALYMNVTVRGLTAHSSMPHLGDNAIYKAARAISKIEGYDFKAKNDPLLGLPTINVGKIAGGLNLNSVPDFAEFTIDVRSTSQVSHADVLEKLKFLLGDEMNIETLVDMPAVASRENDPFVKMVYKMCSVDRDAEEYPRALPYLTDGSVLQKHYGGVPTIILGPGQAEMAHQTDEFCYVGNIIQSVEIFKNILLA